MPRKIIIVLLISILLSPYLNVGNVKAVDAPPADDSATSTVTADDGNGEEDPNATMWVGSLSSDKEIPTISSITELILNMQSRRIGGERKEQTLPRIGMSQCDQSLVTAGKIDERVLESLNYLVRPVQQGGAGMTYLHVTFSKECEEEVPELLNGAYPVIFDGETEDPNNPGYALQNSQENAPVTPGSTNTPSSSLLNSDTIKSVVNAYSTQKYKGFSELSKIISPLASAATLKNTDVEPDGVDNVHKQGQAVDIMAAGLLMCVTKSGGLKNIPVGIGSGAGSKSTRQDPRPIKVSWQTDKGVSNVNTPYGQTFDQMASTMGLDQFLEGFAAQDGTFRAQALQAAFAQMGFSLIANQLGIKAGTFDPATASLNYQTMGYAMLADLMDLPDMSVFDPFANDGISQPNPLQTRRDNVDTLLKTTLLRTVEKDLSLPAGSLDGDTVEDVMTNAGKRRLEKDLGLAARSLNGSLEDPSAILQSIGQAKMESSFHLPIGATNASKVNNSGIISGIIENTTNLLKLTSDQKSYAENVVRASFSLPSSVSLADLTNSNSGFWKDGSKSQTVTDRLKAYDKQLYPKDNTPDLTSPGAIAVIDDIRKGSFDDLTFRVITNRMSLTDYQKVIGLGALLNQYGIYSSTSGSSNRNVTTNGRAVDFPPDEAGYGLTGGKLVDIDQKSTISQLRKKYNDPLAEIITITTSQTYDGRANTTIKKGYINAKKVSIRSTESTDSLRSFYNDPNAIIVTQKNNFITNLIAGDKNYWVALGVNVLASSLQMNPDERLKITQNTDNVLGQSGFNVPLETRTGMVADAIAGKRSFGFSAASANFSMSLSPSDFLNLIGSGLAKDRSDAKAKSLADQRADAVINIAKQRFGYSFDSMAGKAVGDRELVNVLYAYDQKREASHDAIEVFTVTDHSQTAFQLSNRVIALKSFEMTDREGAPLVAPQTKVSNDGYTVLVPADSFKNTLGNITVKITYSTYAKKAGQASQISPDLFQSLFNNPSALSGIALQLGAAKMSLAFNLPTNALGLAAQLLDPKASGTTGLGQSALEQTGGLILGSLSGGTIGDLISSGKITRDQLNRMFLLEAGWYEKIEQNDTNFIETYRTALYVTDQYYKIELGSTLELLLGRITLDQYKKLVGQASLRYNMGGVLAGTFDLHIAGYRLNAQDFYDILNGEWYMTGERIGARLQEKNHNLPIGSLALSLINGKTGASLQMLATNAIATAFHLNSLNITDMTSITQIKYAIGQSTIEQALGFGNQTFIDGNALDVAERVGAENFANAFGITLPQYVFDQLNQVKYSYHQSMAINDRNKIILAYLNTILANGLGVATEQVYDANTKARFEAIDYSLGIEKGSTLKFMTLQINSSDYIKLTGQKAVDDGINSQLASLLGVPDSYVFEGKKIVDAIKSNDFTKLKTVAEEWGGKYFDAQIGWTDGTFKNVLENVNNTAVIKAIITNEGSKILAKMTNLPEDAYKGLFSGNLVAFEANMIASQVNIVGYTADDAAQLFNGHFTAGMNLIGTALMSNTEDMKKAGITYNELRNSLYIDPTSLRSSIIDTYLKSNPGISREMIENDQEFAWIFDADKQNFSGKSWAESTKQSVQKEARQTVTYKYLDFQAKSLLPSEYAKYIQPGFARAMVGGSYSYIDIITGKTISLSGDEARWRYAKDFFTSYAVDNIPILKELGVSANTLTILSDYALAHKGDEKWLESALMANNGQGFADLGRNLDKLTKSVFGLDFAPGTGAALITYSFDGNVSALGNNLWSSWQGKVFNWADSALGFKSGTTSVIYQGITAYQSALSAYQEASFAATNLVMEAAATGDLATFDSAMNQAGSDMSSASRQFKTQTAMIIASVANIVFQKQIGQIETALGLAPGTLIYLVQYLISPDPITLGLFIFFNFFWGGSSTRCAIDRYPDGDPFNMTNIIQSQASLMQNLINSAGSSISLDAADTANATNAIDKKLLPPKPFKGDTNDDYRAGIKAGAQYEVRRTIGSLLIMGIKNTASSGKPCQPGSLIPCQIGTLSEEDINMFEPISARTDLYGPLSARPEKIGPGWFEKTVDRVHLGF